MRATGIFRGYGQVNNAKDTFQDALMSLDNGSKIREAYKMMPMRDALTKAKMQEQQFQIDQQPQDHQNRRQQQRMTSVIQGFAEVDPYLQSGDAQGARRILEARAERLTKQGIPNNDTLEAIAMTLDPQRFEQLKQLSSNTLQNAGMFGVKGNARQHMPKSAAPYVGEDGNTYQDIYDPNSGKSYTQQVEGAPKRNTYGDKLDLDAEQKIGVEKDKAKLARRTTAINLAVAKSGKAWDSLNASKDNLHNYDDAMEALQEGAKSGALTKFFPSFRTASIKLDNAGSRLGLGVISSVTFGALSEKELETAFDTAMPKGLSEPELFEWVKEKKKYTEFAMGRFEDAAHFLGSGENTLTDWVEYSKSDEYRAKVAEREQSISSQYSGLSLNKSSNNGNSVIKFDKHGNRINE